MTLTPFSTRYPTEFLSRTEDNFEIFIEKLRLFYMNTREDIGDGLASRRSMNGRFSYSKELADLEINETGISTEDVSKEFNDMLQGCIRQHDPLAAFNTFPSPLFDAIAGATLMNLYSPNILWDLLSGKLCLYEKKIIKTLASLVDWPNADGYVITGGKQALIYAIKNGLERAKKNTSEDMSDFVVLTSDVSHFCIEHVCSYLGMQVDSCLRIPSTSSGIIDLSIFSSVLEESIVSGKRIAAIIAVGGATINFIPDPIKEMKQIIDTAVMKHQLDYVPYLHVDSVISWAWLAFKQAPVNSWIDQIIPAVAEKIQKVLSNFSGIELVDSFAADFHKTGFCPYSAGVFVAKDVQSLSGMPLDKMPPKQDLFWGESEVYRQTLENSRSGLSIATIWITLRRLGLVGLRQFILYQLGVCECFKDNIKKYYHEHFEILNDHTTGWDIVLKLHFSGNIVLWANLQIATAIEQESYASICRQFLSELWYGSLNGKPHRLPVIGFIKAYSRKGSQEKRLPAFLIHPCSLHYDHAAIIELLEGIVQIKINFEEKLRTRQDINIEDEYLAEVIPPR